MRLFAKFFLCATLVISLALLISGYLLITYSHESSIERETNRAISQYQYDKFTVQAKLISNEYLLSEEPEESMLMDLASELNGMTAFFSKDKSLLYSDLPPDIDFSIPDNVSDQAASYQFQTIQDKNLIMVCGKLTQGDFALYLLIATDISSVSAQKEQMMSRFIKVYFISLFISISVIILLTLLITAPIKRMNKAAAEVACGNYNKRLPVVSSDETGELSKSFNRMADAVEDKINELLLNASQKEDFVANFAHELKTPLTSVIGYADMIYQKKLSPEQSKEAAWYILNEGLRLEALSFKLLDLIVLNREEFILEEMTTEELFENIEISLKPLLTDKNVSLSLHARPDRIMIEYDLFKTLVLNLIDNAIKAGCSKIEISGEHYDDIYQVCFSDNGHGIPEQELNRITEAFYMVDKSRSRKQHGAGLGLALAVKIAKIHGSSLDITSSVDIGTAIKINLTKKGGSVRE